MQPSLWLEVILLGLLSENTNQLKAEQSKEEEKELTTYSKSLKTDIPKQSNQSATENKNEYNEK